MQYNEEHRDLFTVGIGYILAHCISSDYVMGAGIAKIFTQYGVKATLNTQYPKHEWNGKGYILSCTMEQNGYPRTVINLVTKQNVYDKPTYETLEQSLIELRDYMTSRTLQKLAIPKIGCGLDGLDWLKVQQIIKNVFNGTMIDILVCDWP